ncbi:hypothetical protein BDV93DRAFT_512270 [Ceratobasidium sp. AG-I]|nr:hypothetical protein BDV93DRAFT_512270 [Ceratobasidium sp. AG-I]
MLGKAGAREGFEKRRERNEDIASIEKLGQQWLGGTTIDMFSFYQLIRETIRFAGPAAVFDAVDGNLQATRLLVDGNPEAPDIPLTQRQSTHTADSSRVLDLHQLRRGAGKTDVLVHGRDQPEWPMGLAVPGVGGLEEGGHRLGILVPAMAPVEDIRRAGNIGDEREAY